MLSRGALPSLLSSSVALVHAPRKGMVGPVVLRKAARMALWLSLRLTSVHSCS